ncbi:MAG: hypothetical protein ABIA37_05620 [Candidatus Woesearchaeota archaeon]
MVGMSLSLREDVKPEHCFWLADGNSIKNLQELAEALLKMKQSTFDHHVNEQKNDFYKWVKDIYQNQKFAKKLLKSTDKIEMSTLITRRLGVFERPIIQTRIVTADVKKSIVKKDHSIATLPKQRQKRVEIITRPFPEKKKKRTIIPDRDLELKEKVTKIKKLTGESSKEGLKGESWITHDRFKIAASLAALVVFVLFVGLGSGAGSLSGAVVGVDQAKEIQFLGLGGMLGALILLVILLKVHREAKQD